LKVQNNFFVLHFQVVVRQMYVILLYKLNLQQYKNMSWKKMECCC